jgi:hypothetical protein
MSRLCRQLAIGLLSAVLICSSIAYADSRDGDSGECNFKGDKWKSALTLTEKMWAGSLARLCAQTLLHPLDTIRTRRQVRWPRIVWKIS